MSLLPPGFRLGHATDLEARTGCTVILCPPQTRGSCEIRGSSPGSRELALLAPERSMQEVHALVLTGGSAFGLATGDAVMRWLHKKGIGYQTPWQRVPIVPAAVVFDLNVGRSDAFPTEAMAVSACESASSDCDERGSVGAGTGTTVGKWLGIERAMTGGFGAAQRQVDELRMTALAVVNAVGDIIDAHGTVLAGARGSERSFAADETTSRTLVRKAILGQTNTTLTTVLSNGAFTKLELFKIAQRMHDGMSRAVIPCHTSFDGDVTFALSSGVVATPLDDAAELAAELTAEAIRDAVRGSRPLV